MATAFQAMRLGAVLYIVPFMFVYSPALLAIGSLPEILHATLTAGVGIFCLSAGLQGWLRCKASPAERVLLLGTALALIVPGLYTDLVGLGLLGLALVSQVLRGRRRASSATVPSLD